MAHPWAVDGGDSLNILNKQSWRADKGWSSVWGLGEGLGPNAQWSHTEKAICVNKNLLSFLSGMRESMLSVQCTNKYSHLKLSHVSFDNPGNI
jgi:hypothetical protein